MLSLYFNCKCIRFHNVFNFYFLVSPLDLWCRSTFISLFLKSRHDALLGFHLVKNCHLITKIWIFVFAGEFSWILSILNRLMLPALTQFLARGGFCLIFQHIKNNPVTTKYLGLLRQKNEKGNQLRTGKSKCLTMSNNIIYSLSLIPVLRHALKRPYSMQLSERFM